ncbi:MAG TPA: hypothetical protein PKC23_04215 [Candidatus Desulfobacillus sp.]|nr:hypothetical protein [Candidatus Desulfobacillus sp.]
MIGTGEFVIGGSLAHNMSVPPKSVMKYSGLAACRGASGQDAASAAAVLFGTPLRFELPPGVGARTLPEIMKSLGIERGGGRAAREARLAALIDARAAELPLPEGCVVIPANDGHHAPWPDLLTALAVLAKCSESVWLRAKTPAFAAALRRRRASLLVPPEQARRLAEGAA